MPALNTLLMSAIAESTGAPPIVPIPTTGFGIGSDYTVNWKGLATPSSAISQQGTFVRLQGGPTLANGDTEHCQIISKEIHPSSFRLTMDIIVRDSTTPGTDNDEACLLYWAMSGDTDNGYPNDITSWTAMDTVAVDGSTRYEIHSFGYRMSYDPLDAGGLNDDQIRLRQSTANGGLNLPIVIGTGLPNTQPGSFPFITGKTYRCIIEKSGQSFSWKYQNTTDALAQVTLPLVTSDMLDDYLVGRFIFRVMAGRTVDIKVVSVEDIGGIIIPPDPDPIDTTNELPAEVAAKTVRVTSVEAFKAALAQADVGRLDGWTIYVDPGAGTVWGDNLSVTKRSDPTKSPCVIRTVGPGDVTLGGTIVFDTASTGVLLWGFKRRGVNARTTLLGKSNHLRRMDVSGWGTAQPAIVVQKGNDCTVMHHAFHDPQDWTQAERDKYAADRTTALRMSIRHTGVSNTSYMNRMLIYSVNVYNFQTKPIATDYNSGQNDFTEPAPDVDNTAGYSPVLLVNWDYQKILIEATHLQGADAGATQVVKGCATFDIKAGGVWCRNSTFLMPGRVDFRGNGGSRIQNCYLECPGIFVSGGGATTTPAPAQPDAPSNFVMQINMVRGPTWGTPGINFVVGNAQPNARQGALQGMFQQCEGAVAEDLWGGSVTVGKTVDVSVDAFGPKNTIVRRYDASTKITVVAGKQTNTSQNPGAGPTGTKPTKQTRTECGYTATYVAPAAPPPTW